MYKKTRIKNLFVQINFLPASKFQYIKQNIQNFLMIKADKTKNKYWKTQNYNYKKFHI